MKNIDDQSEQRSRAVETILSSTSRHKVVVAGPGTGKTYLFKEICKRSDGNVIALTFINNLANDLKSDLNDLAECCTFHALCKKLIYQLRVPPIDKFNYFPKVDALVRSDRQILEPSLEDSRKLFEDFSQDNPSLRFYLSRSHYYKAVGHIDGVYQVAQHLKSHPTEIPVYDQVLVDEFQDFNRLEVAMIELLALASPTLIVGDDDQALYDFKNASPVFLRRLAANADYELFSLPYCSRCTAVIVEATNQIVDQADKSGFLNGRIKKPFKCFIPSKDEDNKRFPKLIHVTCSVHKANAPYVTRFIRSEIQRIVEGGYRPDFNPGVWDFIIAGPGHYVRGLADSLLEVFPNTFHASSDKGDITPVDSYQELMRDLDSDAGWRSTLSLYKEETVKRVVEASRSMKTPFRRLVPEEVRQDVMHTLDILAKLRDEKSVDTFEETRLVEIFGQSIVAISKSLGFTVEKERNAEPSAPKHTIRISSVLGCKGLSANYMFLVGLDNGMLPADPTAPTDYEICKLLVGLTRARKKCYLVSVGNLFGRWQKNSIFLDWIDSTLMESFYVNKDYFKRVTEID